jgi:RND superfamily putative drug exporter
MRALATWCVRHRRAVVGTWLGILILLTVLSSTLGTAYTQSFNLPNTESTQAADLLKKALPAQSGDTERIVFAVSKGESVTSPAIKARVEKMLAEVSDFPHVSNVTSPYSPLGTKQVSADERIAFAIVNFDVLPFKVNEANSQRFVDIAASADSRDLTVAVSGQIASQSEKPSVGGTWIGVGLAGLVLLLVFGSVWAMALPLVSALASLGTAIAVIGLLSNVFKMPTFTTQLVVLIGLGVGVDYALFIVTRHRQGLLAGMDNESSIANAVDTSGRAVLFAGVIVCIALLGMFALGVSFLYGMAVAASLGVAFTMIAALTLLPALLGFIGPRVMSSRQRRSLATDGPRIVGASMKGFWPRWADFIQRRPIIPAVVALALVCLIAAPFFSMRLGTSDQGNDPKGSTTRVAYDLLSQGFGPGFNGPLQLVTVTQSDAEQASLASVYKAVGSTKGVAEVVDFPPIKAAESDESVNLALVYPTSSPQSLQTSELLANLRATTLPDATKGTGVHVLVGGITAIFVDFAHVLSEKLPLFIGLVVLLSFLLLAMVFRSVVIPLTAAGMNLLSIAAAFGVITAVFQQGWFSALFGVTRTGPVEAFLPVMMFAILFGLSMDYEVFLISRIHEEWLRSGDNRTAVRNGLAATGKTISAAALIMILVFGSFILGGVQVIKEFGLGLAAGVAVDAILIRMAIVPAVMELFGRANWWFPRWADRILPRLSVEPEEHSIAKVDAGTSD